MPETENSVQLNAASYPGLDHIAEASYTCSHGIGPGTATVVTRQQGSPAPFGPVTFSDGTGTVVVRYCKVVDVSVNVGGDGQSWTYRLHDRRWRWSSGRISGEYNQMDPAGKLVPWQVRSPKELAVLCLDAMGERNYTIDLPKGLASDQFTVLDDWFETGWNANPTGTNPPVNWDDENPAQALARLAEQFGRRVVYDHVNDVTRVCVPGKGQALPPGHVTAAGQSVAVPATPDGIGVIGAPIRYQMRLRLEAVGIDWDGKYVPIDNLTYAPVPRPGGRPWDFESPGRFGGVRPTNRLSFQEARQRAMDSVFRCYRVADVGVQPGPRFARGFEERIVVPGYGPLTRRHQLVLQNARVQQVVPMLRRPDQANPERTEFFLEEYYDGASRDARPLFYGSCVFFAANTMFATRRTENVEDGSTIDLPYSLDPTRLVVTFGRPTYIKYRDFSDAVPAETLEDRKAFLPARPAPLVIETAVMVRDAKTGELVRYRRWFPVGKKARDNATPAAGLGVVTDASSDPPEGKLKIDWFRHEDVVKNVIGEYAFRPRRQDAIDAAGNYVEPWDGWYGGEHVLSRTRPEPIDDAAKRADFYLAAHAVAYSLKAGETNTYAGIVATACDGGIQQVTVSVGGGGPTTVMSRNCEHNAWVPPMAARRQAEDLRPNPAAAGYNLNLSGPANFAAFAAALTKAGFQP